MGARSVGGGGGGGAVMVYGFCRYWDRDSKGRPRLFGVAGGRQHPAVRVSLEPQSGVGTRISGQ